jgi:hypothetical protein
MARCSTLGEAFAVSSNHPACLSFAKREGKMIDCRKRDEFIWKILIKSTYNPSRYWRQVNRLYRSQQGSIYPTQTKLLPSESESHEESVVFLLRRSPRWCHSLLRVVRRHCCRRLAGWNKTMAVMTTASRRHLGWRTNSSRQGQSKVYDALLCWLVGPRWLHCTFPLYTFPSTFPVFRSARDESARVKNVRGMRF